jgi:hypothetical protein
MKNEHPSTETKKALVKVFGKENVRVQRGRGTAYGWVEASINIKKLDTCSCPETIIFLTDRCQDCKDLYNEAKNKAYGAVRNIEFYTYYGDMDNEPRNEFLLNINLI